MKFMRTPQNGSSVPVRSASNSRPVANGDTHYDTVKTRTQVQLAIFSECNITFGARRSTMYPSHRDTRYGMYTRVTMQTLDTAPDWIGLSQS
ncbi:hypothetical protein J6590_037339 [Homalodisca vitripennis]|nr:hypothetical protein J6590_037339 [Homalodisca vitripennis]